MFVSINNKLLVKSQSHHYFQLFFHFNIVGSAGYPPVRWTVRSTGSFPGSPGRSCHSPSTTPSGPSTTSSGPWGQPTATDDWTTGRPTPPPGVYNYCFSYTSINIKEN